MAIIDRTANSISEARAKIIAQGGLQSVARYTCSFQDPLGEILTSYPISVTLPQRSFFTVPFSWWGPVENIPVRREYGECAMTFIIHQDWLERRYFERWMDSVIPPVNTEEASGSGLNIGQTIVGVSNPFSTEISASQYADYSNTKEKQLGSVLIECKDTTNQYQTAQVILRDAYPLSITPTSLSADASGYGTFIVIFTFRDYIFS